MNAVAFGKQEAVPIPLLRNACVAPAWAEKLRLPLVEGRSCTADLCACCGSGPPPSAN